MLAYRIYYGSRRILRIYRAGKVIWPPATELPLSAISDLFPGGYHGLGLGAVIALMCNRQAAAFPSVAGTVLPSLGLYGAAPSKTLSAGGIFPADGICCLLDRESLTAAEHSALIRSAVSFADLTAVTSGAALQGLTAAAVYGAHGGEQTAIPEGQLQVFAAVCGDHRAEIAADPQMNAEIPAAVFGAFTEDAGNRETVSLHEAPSAVYADLGSDSKTAHSAAMIPFRVDGVVEMETDTESRTDDASVLDVPDPAALRSMLRLVTTCRAQMLAASAAAADAREGSNTAAAIFLHFDGEEPEESWYDPVQTGSNLYIRSAWLFWHDGDKGHIDTDIWYEVIRDGSNLYIRSVDSSWQDGEKAYMDLSVFYEPKLEASGLYIRSAYSLWTYGGSANIDTDFFLEPVQEGSNLYIRQNIFGGE